MTWLPPAVAPVVLLLISNLSQQRWCLNILCFRHYQEAQVTARNLPSCLPLCVPRASPAAEGPPG